MHLSGSITALATPFTAAGEIDIDAWRRLVEAQVAAGTQALVVAGSTGEAAALYDGEYDALLRSAVEWAGGHIPVLATDIDPTAVQVAAENTRLNQVASYIETRTAAGFHHPVFSARAPFDLIVANILARPLMALAPQMARFVTPGGSLVLSGILERQRNAVLAAYCAQRVRHVATLPRDGWVTLHLKR